MSTYDASEALRAGLWEQFNQLTANASERIDRLLVGDELYEHSQEVITEVRRIEREMELERYREAVRISKRNRGEE